ncbi:MAG: prolyl aminopeptidase [Gammaproteobacteria bacterium]
MNPLYPAIKAYTEHQLAVDNTHKIYIEECGSPHGFPIIVVHDGPGAGCRSYHRRFFDPEVFRIILYDQRGTGRSTPHSELGNNTTQNLITDLEAIRNYLNINTWALFGGGWGALLSLAYAQAFPQYINHLVLYSVLLGRTQDIQWQYHQGANLIFPDYWQDFTSHLTTQEHTDVINAYHQRLHGNDDLARMWAAKSWSRWKARCATLRLNTRIIDDYSDPRFALNLALIESHYLQHQYFLEEDQIINNRDKIKDIPGYIVHSRYDMVCPLEAAWELHCAWPAAELFTIRDAGHSDKELGLIDALILATKEVSAKS